jgi:hypothetical protein
MADRKGKVVKCDSVFIPDEFDLDVDSLPDWMSPASPEASAFIDGFNLCRNLIIERLES